MSAPPILALPLTAAAFAPFGDVVSIDLRGGITANQGSAVRFDWTAALASTRPEARANLVVMRSIPRPVPFEACVIEQHPCSSQTFVPMRCSRYLACVAPTLPDGSPDEAGLAAFVCGPGQGVSYRLGVWHHGIVALDEPAEFAMLVWEGGGPSDCVEHRLAVPRAIVVPAPAPRAR
jgi:ureidoglycolate lyase